MHTITPTIEIYDNIQELLNIEKKIMARNVQDKKLMKTNAIQKINEEIHKEKTRGHSLFRTTIYKLKKFRQYSEVKDTIQKF